jgi:hypothetical protein
MSVDQQSHRSGRPELDREYVKIGLDLTTVLHQESSRVCGYSLLTVASFLDHRPILGLHVDRVQSPLTGADPRAC